MPAERSGPAVSDSSGNMGGKGEMTKAPDDLQDLRRKIYAKAKAEPHWRFWGLYVHVCKIETLRAAYGGKSPQLPKPISHGKKRTGERSARKSHATFDAAGAGNVTMAAGLRATAKAVEHPPEPKVGAPVLDPTVTGGNGSRVLVQRTAAVGTTGHLSDRTAVLKAAGGRSSPHSS